MDSQTEGGTENRNMDQIRIMRVPANLMEFLRSRIVHYVKRTENLSAEIHEMPGQPAKLVLHGGESAVSRTQEEAATSSQDNNAKSKKILVKNIPIAADGEILVAFFEYKYKEAGSCVSVQLNREKNWAIIEFCETGAVEYVMSKTPVKMMNTELDISPYVPLIEGDTLIERIDLSGIPNQLTKELLTMHIEGMSEDVQISSAEYKVDQDDSNVTTKKRETTRKCISNFKSVQLRMLQSTGYWGRISKMFPGTKVRVSRENKEISFEGDDVMVISFLMDLTRTLLRFPVLVLHGIPDDQLEFFKRQSVVKYINDTLDNQNCTCVMDVEGKTICVCCLKTDMANCMAIIKTAVQETQFHASNKYAALFLSSLWQAELDKLQERYETWHKVSTDSDGRLKLQVLTTDDGVNFVFGRIQSFIHNNKPF